MNKFEDFIEYSRKIVQDSYEQGLCDYENNFWRDVKEDVPAHEKEICVCFAKGLYGIGYYNTVQQKFLSKEHYEINPIAWADIPEYTEDVAYEM